MNSKPCKDKSQVGKHITGGVHSKTGNLSDRRYESTRLQLLQVMIEECIADSHDLGDLVQATCNWTIVLTKDVS